MEEVLALRGKLLGTACSFRCTITADYGQMLETFTLDCESPATGALDFTVVGPEGISGITGMVDADRGYLTFDDQVLAVALLDDGTLSPLCAPWVLLQALRQGCITSVARTQDGVQLCVDASYGEDAIALEIWLDSQGLPKSAQLSKDGRRMVSMELESVCYA